jgi:hypothetical protein
MIETPRSQIQDLLAHRIKCVRFPRNGNEEVMARKKCPPDDDGPTINGRPILRVGEVQNWFLDQGCSLPDDDAGAIVQDLNHCAFVSSFLEKCVGPQSRPSKQSFSSKYAANYTALKLLQGNAPRTPPSARSALKSSRGKCSYFRHGPSQCTTAECPYPIESSGRSSRPCRLCVVL